MSTIGAMGNTMIDSKLREMEKTAIRYLLELEDLARDLRGDLEDGGNTLVDLTHKLTDLHSHAMNVISLLDRSMALEEAKGYIT